MIRQIAKKGICALLTVSLAFPVQAAGTAKPSAAATTPAVKSAGEEGFDFSKLEEGSYVEGEVLVRYKDGALKKDQIAKSTEKGYLGKLRRQSNISVGFGAVEEASGGLTDVISTADAQMQILSESLGSDYVIEESVGIDASDAVSDQAVTKAGKDAGINISLVSSDRYDTKELIEKLSQNDDIEYAEPNYIVELTDADDEKYAFDDEYIGYSHNIPIMETYSGWDEITGEEDEVVVAVLDTGLDLTHPDLEGRIWENPGTLGLLGPNGFDFVADSSTMIDDNGHGTHCAGIIAAKADNEIGISGVTGKANVKIMPLRIIGNDESSVVTVIGAFEYVLQAKERGVNIAATSNSWGMGSNLTDCRALAEMFDRLGSLGIMNFFAAGNDNLDLDRITDDPVTANSQYTTIVGAMSEYGKKAGFSNYGRSSTDLFVPGTDILSAFSTYTYLPAIYPADRMKATTEYYGEFSGGATAEGDSANAISGDDGMGRVHEGIKTFDASKVIIPEGVSCEMEIVGDKWFNASENPSALKVSFDNVKKGQELFICFPYEKNKNTNGSNTRFSILGRSSYVEGGGEASVTAGDVIFGDDITPYLYKGGVAFRSLTETRKDLLLNSTGYTAPYDSIPEGGSCGIGMKIKVTKAGKLELYIDSLGVSGQVDPSNFGKYELMSGTSQACPAAAGIYALLCAADPEEDYGGEDYALYMKGRLFSLVRRTPEFEDLCSTGGYIDCSRLHEIVPSISRAIADTDQWTVTLQGMNLDSVTALYYKRQAQKDAEKMQISDERCEDIYYEISDGELILHHAKDLIGSYIRFFADNGENEGTGTFFLVDGEKPFEQIDYDLLGAGSDEFYELISDGTTLFGVGSNTGDLMIYTQGEDGNYGFLPAAESTLYENLEPAIYDYLNPGTYDLINEEYSYIVMGNPVIRYGTVVQMLRAEIGTKFGFFMVSHDLYDPESGWRIDPVLYPPGSFPEGRFAAYNDNILFIGETDQNGTPQNSVYGLSMLEDEPYEGYLAWTKIASMEHAVSYPTVIQNGPYLYVFGGFDENGEPSGVIQRFDGDEWTTLDMELPTGVFRLPVDGSRQMVAAPVDGGFIVTGESTDGYGDTYLIDLENNAVKPVYYTISGGLSESSGKSAAITQDGLYVFCYDNFDSLMAYSVLKLDYAEDTFDSAYTNINYSESGPGFGDLTGPEHATKGKMTYFTLYPEDGSYVDEVTADDGIEVIQIFEDDDLYGFVAGDDPVRINVNWGKITEEVYFTKATDYMVAGSSFTFEAETDGSINSVTYSTSNEDYAEVDPETGEVTVKAEGIGKTIKIYATSVESPNLRAVFDVYIGAVQAEGIAFVNAPESIKAGQELALSVKIEPVNVTCSDVTYRSSNESWAVVDEKGVLKALPEGVGKTVYITAVTSNSMKAVIGIKITEGDPAPVTPGGETKEKEPQKTPAAKGTKLSEGKNKPVYTVLSQGDAKNPPTVSYTSAKKQQGKAKTVKVPDTVVFNGVTYNVVSVTNGSLAFEKKAKTIDIGENVESLPNKAFKGCKKLKVIKIRNKNKIVKLTKKTFTGLKGKITLKVPAAFVSDYRKQIKKLKLTKKVSVKKL